MSIKVINKIQNETLLSYFVKYIKKNLQKKCFVCVANKYSFGIHLLLLCYFFVNVSLEIQIFHYLNNCKIRH